MTTLKIPLQEKYVDIQEKKECVTMMNNNSPYSKAGLITVRIAQVTILVACIFSVLFISTLLKSPEPDWLDFNTNAQNISKDNPTDFKIYKNKVYVSVPSNGDYIIENADINSIRAFTKSFNTPQIALDINHVYCGNLILPQLNPAKTVSIGDGYVTDGQLSYYCSPSSERNKELNPLDEVYQILKFNLGYGAKPQTYLYPFMALKQTTQPYTLKIDSVASNGTTTYFRGLEMADAQASSLRYLTEFTDQKSALRTSDDYMADGQSVYYDDIKLKLKDQPQLSSFKFDGSGEGYYLYEPSNQLFYYHQFAFDTKFAPYRLLNRNSDHAEDPLFLSPQGIFFYNRKINTLQKAGENPFKQKWIQLAPDVYHNGQDTFYLGIYNKIIKTRRGQRTSYRSTVLYQLPHTPLVEWKKISDIQYGHDFYWVAGSIWKNSDKYYYFDELGQGQLFNSAIYMIADQKTLKILQNKNKRMDDIRPLIDNNQLIAVPDAKIFAQAKVKVNYEFFDSWSN
jgi:hypothetical protein